MHRLLPLLNLIVARIFGSEEGQGLTEYALVLGVIALLAVAALHFLGGHITSILSSAGSSL